LSKPISALPDGVPAQPADMIPVARAGGNAKIPASEFLHHFSDDETPAGSVDGSNADFSLVRSPSPAASLRLYLNGVLQRRGVDYILVGNAVTYVVAPSTGDNHRAFYRY
jgi:hypothetical protein